ncbi:SDR family oxidoreductase [Pseudomonas sp. BN102]|uniref:NAD-dependent epimerase/dehydratase family protein n=1 Tax=Pseudomonas sp. BN102 TaxID=2567886 RepID=UPI00245667E7|nr:SDR family oxidoreductase [Pseudomonas sp. BN102]MDH4609083.1 SDR family oxidoreductase [Pseudomonas sp. BN102]
MSAVMITGGLGYVGRYLTKKLSEQGVQVVSYNRDYSEAKSEFMTPVQGELYDIPRIVKTIREFEIDRVIHTAAMSHPDLSIDLPITTVAANIDGTVHLLEAMRLAGIKKLVNFSSETVYGHVEGVVNEQAPVNPTTPYGVTKLATEHFGRVYNELYGMEVVSLRIAEVYGPENKMPQVLRDILKTVQRGDKFFLPSGGDHRFHYVHVEDVVRAVLMAAQAKDIKGSVFNIAGDRPWKLHEAVDVVKKLIPGADIEIGGGYWHLDRQGEWDLSAAERELGYRAEWSLEKGLEHYSNWLIDHEY